MRGEKKVIEFLVLAVSFIFLMNLVSAGVGIKWDKESTMVPEKTKTCLTYFVYNPWDSDVYTRIELSEELQEIVKSQENEVKLIPAGTSSSQSIPVEFCFKTPNVYERDCWIGDSLICKKECNEEMKIYSGEVLAREVSESEFTGSGSGGSATQMSVSAPLKVRVQCVPHSRNYSLIYATIALIAAILLAINIIKEKRKYKDVKKKKKDKEEDEENGEDSSKKKKLKKKK
jgi:hypothetical protein